MSLFTDALDAEIAQLSARTSTPVEPFGYGVDWSCSNELADDLAEVDPNSIEAISQALYRRLTTPNGSLADDPAYGYDVRGLLNRGVTDADRATIASAIKNECVKDDRVESAECAVAFGGPRAIEIALTVTPADGARSFTMTLAVTDGATMLKAIY